MLTGQSISVTIRVYPWLVLAYDLSIFTDFTVTSFTGLSCGLRATPTILLTTSNPSTTSPKMV